MMKIGLRKIFVAVAALASVMVIAYFYLLVLVPNKESELNSRGLRILSQIEQNILEKKINIQKTLDGVYNGRDATGNRKFRGPLIKGLSLDRDSIVRRGKNGVERGAFDIIYDPVQDKQQIRFYGEYARDIRKNENTDTITLYKNRVLAYRYEIDEFLKNVLFYRDDFFEDYVVLRRGEVVYQTSPLAYAGFKADTVDSKSKQPENPAGKILLSDRVKRDTLGGKSRFVFVHPFNEASGVDFVLCGVISTEKYNSEKYLLNTTQIIWITLVFVIAAFSLPILKLITVSEFERLSQYDVLRIGIALTSGSAVLSVCFLLWTHNASQYNRQAFVTRQVALAMDTAIDKEVREISNQWNYQLHLITNQPYYKKWVKGELLPGEEAFVERPDCAHQVENFVLLNHKGRGPVFDIKAKDRITHLELHEREYFKAFEKKHPDIYPYIMEKKGRDKGKEVFYLQPIYSWLDQQNTVVMSKALDSAISIPEDSLGVVLGIETYMFSLLKPALLSEVSFCVLDKDGRVLFHSDEKRNLRENFIAETGNDLLVRAVVTSHVDTTLQVRYYGNDHVAHFQPLEVLPYTLVVLYDTSFFMKALSNQATFTLLMLIVLGLMLTFIIAVSYFLTSQQNVLRRQQLSIKWLYFNSSTRSGFTNLFLWLLVPAALSLLFIRRENVVFVSFFLPVFALALSGAVIYKANKEGYERGFYEKYVAYQFRVFLGVCAGAGAVLLLALLSSGLPVSLCAAFIFILIELAMIVLVFVPDGLPVVNIEKRWSKIRNGHPDRQSWGKYIALPACFLLLLNFSVFPAFNFFITSVRQEREIKQKRNSLELAEGIDRRERWLLGKFNDLPNFDLLKKGIYMPGGRRAVERMKFKAETVPSVDKRNAFLAFYNQVINLPNIAYSDLELQTSFRDLNYGTSAEGTWTWTPPGRLDFLYRHDSPTDTLSYVQVRLPSRKTTIEWIMAGDRARLFVGICISIALLFVVLVFVHKKITLFEYFNRGPDQSKIRKADEEYIRHSIEHTSKNLLVLSLPGSGALEYVTGLCEVSKEDEEPEDKPVVEPLKEMKAKALKALRKAKVDYQLLAYKPGKQADSPPNHSIVLLHDFALNDSDSCLLYEQLSALNECFKSQALKVVWITASDPCEQISLLGKRSLALLRDKKNKDQDDKDETVKGKAVPDADKLKQERSDILRILNDFEKVIYSLEDNMVIRPDDSARYIREEFRFGVYLHDLGQRVMQSSKFGDAAMLDTYFRCNSVNLLSVECSCDVSFAKAEEHFILKIQDMAQNYYYSIWAGLSTREKYVLYDFASDEITNYRNFGILSVLVRKGLLFYDDRLGGLRVMSRSFRNFILTVVDKEEALQLEKEINISGTWETIRIVLAIFFIAIAVFLFATEQTTFNRIIGFITAIASIGPLLLAFVTNLRGMSFGK